MSNIPYSGKADYVSLRDELARQGSAHLDDPSQWDDPLRNLRGRTDLPLYLEYKQKILIKMGL